MILSGFVDFIKSFVFPTVRFNLIPIAQMRRARHNEVNVTGIKGCLGSVSPGFDCRAACFTCYSMLIGISSAWKGDRNISIFLPMIMNGDTRGHKCVCLNCYSPVSIPPFSFSFQMKYLLWSEF